MCVVLIRAPFATFDLVFAKVVGTFVFFGILRATVDYTARNLGLSTGDPVVHMANNLPRIVGLIGRHILIV